MGKRIVDDPDEIFYYLQHDPSFMDVSYHDETGVYIMNPGEERRYITQLTMEGDDE